MTEQHSNRADEAAGAPSPEGVTGDPGAAGPLDLEVGSGLALGNTEADAGGYGGVLDGGELADSVDAGELRDRPGESGVPESPAPERRAATPEQARERGEL